MKRIAVATTSRADFGILQPILTELRAAPDCELLLVVSGTHLSPRHGETRAEIEAGGWEISAQVDCILETDAPGDLARAMGRATAQMAEVLEQLEPDVLIVTGDRFEMHALAVAAVPFEIPIAHIHGGELTAGAIDDSFRHSLTKLAHLHFVASEEYARRVRQLGEEDWRIVVAGAPALDNVQRVPLLDREQFAGAFGIELPEQFLLVTFHPVSREFRETQAYADQLASALEVLGIPVLVTAANADTFGSKVNERMRRLASTRSDVWFVDSLGVQGYYSAMAMAAAMVGNSSSGIIEAASFGLPVVNIGRRQAGRARGPNVLDVAPDAESIVDGVRRALSEGFTAAARATRNPYDAGGAAGIVVEALRSRLDDPRLWQKQFVDIPEAS